ncbi:type I-E CRISPR-associated protein Cas5/CasD [Brachybacterium sp. p3-SID957]|uniref:type I-E CRISPR-associated protein Cas5/CasD n=1 Tax=Brachybacterium sp. p3-SID957 TaxID=2916049 RepID=UPI00223BBDEA|nr:type I-E CRISPR-associated protein Cas5/CasD [Brachybacterium sp. p3-SID957]MCT1775639.1 type I-E CRISPR-associated protein Cas5/CasD [Brachybacterium sp. p3-SID957]
MNHTLLLRLKGPMQSWGDSSRFNLRATSATPTKSGVIGLVAAAQGRPRSARIDDLAALQFAVRVDQPGTLLHDYQTAERWQTGGRTALVSRYYLADAVFIAAVSSEDEHVLETMEEALRSPRFPLFLGRRSCPANVDLVIGIVEGDAETALRALPWQASGTHRATRSRQVSLPIFRDAKDGEPGVEQRDVPISFDQQHRQYGWRTVVAAEPLMLDNPDGRVDDPFFEAVVSA